MASDSNSSNKPHVYLENTDEVKAVFNRFDSNNDGLICSTELTAVLTALGSDASPDEVARMMEELDSDKDGFVNIQEFAAFCSQKVEGDESGTKELHDAFQMYDEDNNGLISAEELHKVLIMLGEHCTVHDCSKMIQSFDSDGDGNVNFDEFRKMMTNNKQGQGQGQGQESS